MNTLASLPEMTAFFEAIFSFLRKYRIHSFIDHMSDYSQLYDILMEAELEDLRYYPRMDQYVFKLRNVKNRLVDLVYLFSFGCDGRNDQQIMITLNNEKIRVEIIITDNREIPIMKYSTPDKKIAAFWKKKEPPREKMTLQDWDEFLESHNKQYPRRMK
jgi:hypothetical protein